MVREKVLYISCFTKNQRSGDVMEEARIAQNNFNVFFTVFKFS